VRTEAQRSQRDRVVAFVRRQVGKPYVWGATGPRSFDCSGLMLAAYRSVGRTIPRTTSALLAGLRPPRHLRRGDLVFGLPHHVAMYIGQGQVIHAPAPGRRVEIASVRWHRGYASRTVFRPLP
jgi:cell wall-associated NlpC family hydrolase